MPITRRFLDWSQPALAAVVDSLVAEHSDEELTDLSGLIVVVPGGRARRRMLELLIERTESRLIPPEIITEGSFPELLYESQWPFAGQIVQQLAWGEAVRRLPRTLAERVLRNVPDDGDVDGWMALGELLWKLHRELAADQLHFGDVVTVGEHLAGFAERPRWEALHAAQREYLAILDGLELWDRQTARLVAIDNGECRTERQVVLVGTVDLNRTTRAMLDQVADRVTAYVHAPPSLSERFDEHGCLKPDAWKEVEIDFADDQLRVAEGPAEQADEVVRVLASFEQRYRADDVTIGVADEQLVPQLLRRLKQYDVPARWVIGKTLPQTALLRLLTAVADYLDNTDAEHFAELVRHPDLGDWLTQQGIEEDWLTELDAYRTRYLPGQLGFWLGSSDRCGGIRQVHDRVSRLLSELQGAKRPLGDWADPIVGLPLSVFIRREFDPEVLNDRAEIEAFKSLQAALDEYAEVPESLSLVVSGAQAIRLTLERLESEAVPPPRDDTAVELLGWLELPLDDAPALVVTSFNEEYVPKSIDADLFLPNQLRKQLGILDNDRRYARDCYALSAMRASRETLVMIAARRDRRGDPLLPSRLALACDAETVARRIGEFYDTESTPVPLPTMGLSADSLDDREPPGLAPPLPLPVSPLRTEFRVTAFRDFIACPYRFYLKHILQLEPMDDVGDEMSPGNFGTLLHNVLEQFGLSELKGSTEWLEVSELLHQLLEQQAVRQFGRKRSMAVEVQLLQMRTRLDAFAVWQAQRAAEGWSIAFVEETAGERTAVLQVDEELSLTLSGRIDRIDRHADGRWAIFDYKTGEAGDPPNKVHRRKEEWIDLQLPLYRKLAATIGVDGDVALGYITLPRDANEVKAQMADWTDEELRSADKTALDIATRILNQDFLPISDLGASDYDDFAAICQEGVFDRRDPA